MRRNEELSLQRGSQLAHAVECSSVCQILSADHDQADCNGERFEKSRLTVPVLAAENGHQRIQHHRGPGGRRGYRTRSSSRRRCSAAGAAWR